MSHPDGWVQMPDLLRDSRGHRYTAWSRGHETDGRVYQVTRNYPPQPPGAPCGLGGYPLLASVMALKGLSRVPHT